MPRRLVITIDLPYDPETNAATLDTINEALKKYNVVSMSYENVGIDGQTIKEIRNNMNRAIDNSGRWKD